MRLFVVVFAHAGVNWVKTQPPACAESNLRRCNCVATIKGLCVFQRSFILYVAALFFYPKDMDERDITALFIGNRDCYHVKEADIEKAIIEAIENGIEIFF